MTSQRKAIRLALVAQLKAAGTPVADRVHANRVRRWQTSELPAVSIYTRSEQVEKLADSPRLYTRSPELVVEIVADADGPAVDDQLDDLAAALESAVWADPTIAATSADLDLESVEGPSLSENGSTVYGSLRLVFRGAYSWEQPLEEPVDDLARAHVEYDLAPPDQDPEAVDDVEIPTT